MRRVLFISFIILALFLGGCGITKKTSITLTGSIEGKSTNISSEISSKVVDIKKSEGDSIKTGDVVYVLDAKSLQIQKKQLENQLEALKVQVKIARDKGNNDSIKAAEYNLESAEKSLEVVNKSIEDLNSTDKTLPPQAMASLGSSDDNLIKLKLQREQIQSQIDALKLQLKNIRTSSRDNVKLAEYNLKASQESLELLNENIKRCSAASPVDGIITSINFNKGEVVPAGTQLFTVMDNSKLNLKIYVPERYLSKFNVGNTVDVSVPSLNSKAYLGKIVKIDEQGQFTPKNTETVDEKSDVVFGVKFSITGDGTLKPGMIAEVKVNE